MFAAQIEAPGRAHVIETNKPTPGENDVLIEVAVAGICGTDLHIFHGEYEAVYAIITGQELSGPIVACGEHITRFKGGDRVPADRNIPCNRCTACQRNEPNQCETLAAIGVTRDGGFARYVVAPESNVFAIGDLSFAAAALVEPLACVVWGLKRVQVQPGDTALIFGAGPMGCLTLQALRSVGASSVVVTDTVPWRLEQVIKLGATETVLADSNQAQRLKALAPQGYDIVADITGIPKVLEQTFGYARARGKVGVFAFCPADAPPPFLPYAFFP